MYSYFFFQAEDGIRDLTVTGVQTCALPISRREMARALPDRNLLWRLWTEGHFSKRNFVCGFLRPGVPRGYCPGPPCGRAASRFTGCNARAYSERRKDRSHFYRPREVRC